MSASDFEERVVTVPLRDANRGSSTNATDKALSLVREHLAQHFSVDEDVVRMDPSINEEIWSHGRTSPPSSVRIRAARFEEEGDVAVEAEIAE